MSKKNAGLPAGMKKTRQRQAVFSILTQAETPLTAREIFSQAHAEEDALWLSTVYRVLDFFTEEGIVTKTGAIDGRQALYAISPKRHSHYALCLGCRKSLPLENCPMPAFERELAESGFHVLGHKVEMYGYCRDCEKNGSGEK